MAKPKVVVSRMTPGLENASLWNECDVAFAWEEDRIMPADLLREKVADAEGLYITSFDPIDTALLDAAPNLRVISTFAVGTDNIDLPACTERGIVVGNTPGVVTEATADQAFALMLALSRRTVESDRFVKGRQWETWSPYLMISNDLYAKTLGIVGMGRIGQAIARRAVGFEMEILYTARSQKPEAEQAYGAKYASLDELLRRSDIVITILPLTPETKHLIDAEALGKMKETAFLVNVARGPIVDPTALHEALSAGRIKGAALDVTVPEPIAKDDPLLDLDNILIAPHVATGTWECRQKMTDMTVGNLLRGLNGQELLACANPDVQRKAS